jgi:hypothetical protein
MERAAHVECADLFVPGLSKSLSYPLGKNALKKSATGTRLVGVPRRNSLRDPPISLTVFASLSLLRQRVAP